MDKISEGTKNQIQNLAIYKVTVTNTFSFRGLHKDPTWGIARKPLLYMDCITYHSITNFWFKCFKTIIEQTLCILVAISVSGLNIVLSFRMKSFIKLSCETRLVCVCVWLC